MSASVLVEWTNTGSEPEDGRGEAADVTVFTDGRVCLGPRLAGESTWRQLSPQETAELRRVVFDELRIPDIKEENVSRAVDSAAAKRKEETDTQVAELVTGAVKDAGTTVIRVADSGSTHEVRYYDLYGSAREYPDVEDLQRLRRLELRMLEIAGVQEKHPN